MVVMQRCWYLHVRDCGPEGFLAEANYTDTFIDQSLILEVERKTLVIKSAQLEVRRGKPEVASASVGNLVGITAYFGSGRKLREALGAAPALLDMASQALTAVIQAEIFFYQERGFATAAEYEDFWDKTYQNACVLYSNLDRVEQRFMDYVKDHQPGRNLFHRYLTTSLDISGEKSQICGHLMDSFHEMTLSLNLDQDYQIQKASASMLRCPDAVCREALARVPGLEGMDLTTGELKRYHEKCGGSTGCTHIGQLVQEAAYTLDIYQKNKQ
ncbi:MAG: DUF2889 domain-containing protein [Clostridia bacterium]|nr:DUF2889 domain-containing protein [Clostridia bacterium]